MSTGSFPITPPLPGAIVTGASRGIGRAIALRLAADGFKVAINYSRNAESAHDVVATIKASGGEAIAVQGDISDPAGVQKLFNTATDAFGGLDAVVHNAGHLALAPIAPTHLGTFDQVMQINLRGAFLVLAQAAQRVRDGGRIVALSDGAWVNAQVLRANGGFA